MTTSAHLVDAVLAQCARSPDDVALRWWRGPFRLPGRARAMHEVTYRELAVRIERTAASLVAVGLRPGDRVLFSIRPRPEGLVLALAVVRAGGAVVFVDPGSTPELFAARFGAAAPTFAATEALLYALSTGPLRRAARSRGLLLPGYGRLDVVHLYSGRWLPGVPRGARRVAALARSGPAAPERRGGANDEALVVFTSGTTSVPKAVVHTAGSLAAASALLAGVHALRRGDVVHTDQLLLGMPALLAGATWSIPRSGPGRDVRAFVRQAQGPPGGTAATSMFLVPADATTLLDAIESGAVAPGVRGTVLVGGAPVTRALLARSRRVLPEVRWIAVYGMTEVLPVAVVAAEEKLAFDGDGDLVGTPLPGITVRIDELAEDGQPPPGAGPGEISLGEVASDGGPVCGELVVSGPSLMRGYLGGSQVGEHRTGDLAYLDERGRIVLVGRTRDMIIRGTVNIYPGLFEPRIAGLPGVGEAVLVGLPQVDGDERVALVVTACAGTAAGGRSATRSSGDPPAPVARGAETTTRGLVLRSSSPLVTSVTALLPGVLDHGAMPDLVLEVDRVPLSGRSRKPDRRALAQAITAL